MSFRHRPEILESFPDDVKSYLRQYEDWFTLEPPMMKKITDHFVEELEKGLTKEGSTIVGVLRLL